MAAIAMNCYVLPCDIRAVTYGPEPGGPSVEVPPLLQAVESTGLSRDLLIGAAEEALIAALGAPQNQRTPALASSRVLTPVIGLPPAASVMSLLPSVVSRLA